MWQPVAQKLGLTASDIEHIEYNVPPSQGERAYIKHFYNGCRRKVIVVLHMMSYCKHCVKLQMSVTIRASLMLGGMLTST